MTGKKLDIETRRNDDVLEKHPYVNARAARSNFSRLVDSARVDKERVIITAHGEPAAAIVPIRDIRILEQIADLEWVNKISDADFRELDLETMKRLLRGGRRNEGNEP
ncbi:MAG: type II toxin-antitoxin system Phd/YefM family antitoxin [Rhodobacter sp.]|nr:type II toxin-antitoxin system Phd/YefM family antitoxin [Rhodobacter sp.]